jgi:hypothetical protein
MEYKAHFLYFDAHLLVSAATGRIARFSGRMAALQLLGME